MDRGMLSEANIKFLKKGDRRYIIGTPKVAVQSVKPALRKFGRLVMNGAWMLSNSGKMSGKGGLMSIG
jgi:hypothetical protein